MFGRYILLAGRIAIAVPRVQAGMPFLIFGSGYMVRHSLTTTLLVKSVAFLKCDKCERVLYKVKYKMVMCVSAQGREFAWDRSFCVIGSE